MTTAAYHLKRVSYVHCGVVNPWYQPTSNAQNLVSLRTGLLGLTVSSGSLEALPHGTQQYFANLILGATTAALISGEALALLLFHETLGKPSRLTPLLW